MSLPDRSQTVRPQLRHERLSWGFPAFSLPHPALFGDLGVTEEEFQIAEIEDFLGDRRVNKLEVIQPPTVADNHHGPLFGDNEGQQQGGHALRHHGLLIGEVWEGLHLAWRSSEISSGS